MIFFFIPVFAPFMLKMTSRRHFASLPTAKLRENVIKRTKYTINNRFFGLYMITLP